MNILGLIMVSGFLLWKVTGPTLTEAKLTKA